ncbi:MAG TPA: transcriptional regulator, partial [Porphyromonadaceae bacterium]|nr:transcriptional regulator [Porphyromonadaceae bacterium]
PENNQKTIKDEIVELIKENPNITRKELENLLNRTPNSIKYHLEQLTKKGIIKREGSDRVGKWIVIE